MNSRNVNRIKAGIHHSPSWLNWVAKRFPPLVILIAWLVVTTENSIPYRGKKYFAAALNQALRLPKSYVASLQFLFAKILFFPVALLFFAIILLPYRLFLGRRRLLFLAPEPDQNLDPNAWRYF